jgi:hypothetical protein
MPGVELEEKSRAHNFCSVDLEGLSLVTVYKIINN